jgi:hypothetical protein
LKNFILAGGTLCHFTRNAEEKINETPEQLRMGYSILKDAGIIPEAMRTAERD